MSATIKPTTRQCPNCRRSDFDDRSGMPWICCSFCDVKTIPLYTREDLVRVAAGATVCPVRADVMVSDHAEMLVACALGEVVA
jgi:hypothetical protein